jgi:hypothetical protein
MKHAPSPLYIRGNLTETLAHIVQLGVTAGFGSELGICSNESSYAEAFMAKYPVDRWSAPKADQLLRSLDAALKVPERDVVLALRLGVNPANLYRTSQSLYEVIITDWPRHGDMLYPYEEFLADVYSRLIVLG